MRIERGMGFQMATSERSVSLRGGTRRALPLVHDRMTEVVLPRLVDAQALFAHFPPRALTSIALLAEGSAAIGRANAALGLALAPDEIEYLATSFRRMGRDPTDVELMMLAQANSEHCRHKIFNASWIVDGVEQERSLFAMIRHTHATSPQGTIVAYADNAAVMEGATVRRFYPGPDGRYAAQAEATHILMKVETHNHPTAIAPFPGAATGSGGEIHRQAKAQRGRARSRKPGSPDSPCRTYACRRCRSRGRAITARRAASRRRSTIMLEGPIGGASFDNGIRTPEPAGLFPHVRAGGRPARCAAITSRS